MGDRLLDKICLVTGTSRGIGKAIAERFVQEGGIVYASSRGEGNLDEWAAGINSSCTGEIVPVYFDMTDSAAIKSVVMRIKKEYGRLDVLVNNAAMISNELLGMISLKKTREMFDVNVFGLLELSQFVAVKLMKPQQYGSIVNIASIVGVEGSRGQVAYSASKGAVIAITKSMAKELAPDFVRVNAVAPGMIATERLKVTIKETYHGKHPPIGMNRLGKPEEIADACLYFVSDESAYTTGQVLVVGGGNNSSKREFYDIKFE